ncbi:proto-oncogene Mas-like [Ambystoma mexicanum]|uniref:proto-oncogene Mas-like n=1 Tax=Ambystoma mexicanum TaxID=8296 RepID=UPI0037E84E6E
MADMPINATVESWLNETELASDNCTLSNTDKILSTLCLAVSMIGLIGNGTVFFFLGFLIKRNRFTIYILNLAVADFTFLLCCSIGVLYFIVAHEDPELVQNDAAQLTLEIFFSFGYNMSLYLLTAISVERCLSVIFPIWYQCRRPNHQSLITCALLWVLSIVVTSVEYFSCHEEDHVHEGDSSPCEHIIFTLMCLLNFLIFTPLMVVFSLILLVRVRRDSIMRQSSKLYIIVVATVVIFLVFALPMRLVSLLEYEHLEYPDHLVLLTILFSTLSSSLNPLVYFFVGGQWKWSRRSSIRTALRAAFNDALDSSQNGMESIASTTTYGAHD